MTGLGRPGLWGILGVLLILGAPAQAQFGMFNPSPPLTPEESLFRRLPREPRIQNTLEQLVPLIEVQNHQDTIDQLQEMLDTSEDFFDAMGSPWKPLRCIHQTHSARPLRAKAHGLRNCITW